MNAKTIIELASTAAIPVILMVILVYGLAKKVPVYESFTEGAKDGIKVAISIFPYLLAMLAAISMLRASGAIEMLATSLRGLLTITQIPAEILPIMIVRSLSGSAALGAFSDIAANTGVNSFATKLAAIMVGSSETTFYVLAVYFGSVGIKKFRYALVTGILADIVGIIAAVIVARLMFL